MRTRTAPVSLIPPTSLVYVVDPKAVSSTIAARPGTGVSVLLFQGFIESLEEIPRAFTVLMTHSVVPKAWFDVDNS